MRTCVVAFSGLLLSGCFVHVDRVSDPRPAFDRARTEALRVQGRRGPARELNVLAYDPDEEKLVRVCLPMWIVRKARHEADLDWDDWEEGGRAARATRRHLRFEDIERAGLGILVEVEEDDGERVLVWLR